ncbi:hypothetical protein HHK36_002040 [Tetracentron sinense]|uniref:Bulb-type lectin domain-containing protein n=1 Tax=Tetracentron sinense TaxID=13715 RepID=A0A834ZV37_TETSI|nr:hypothetical protein HHK36_002040 [Tetracentron sinense]
MEGHYFLSFCCALLFFFSDISTATDTLSISQSISDNQSLVSRGGSFELGFFSPGSSKKRYLGIWYKKIPGTTVVWVAKRDNPLTNSSGVLKMDTKGNLVLLNQRDSVLWSSNVSRTAEKPVVQLLDSGNLVITEKRDTLGWDLKKRLNRRLSSWKNDDDPSPGPLTYGIENLGYPEAVLRKNLDKYARTAWALDRMAFDTAVHPS